MSSCWRCRRVLNGEEEVYCQGCRLQSAKRFGKWNWKLSPEAAARKKANQELKALERLKANDPF
jgi:hypothetical protein